MKLRDCCARVALPAGLAASPAFADQPLPGARQPPARAIPVPATVSPQLRALIAVPLNPIWNVVPKTNAEWKTLVAKNASEAAPGIAALRAEGLFHAQYYRDITAPETIDYNNEVARFFDKYLGR